MRKQFALPSFVVIAVCAMTAAGCHKAAPLPKSGKIDATNVTVATVGRGSIAQQITVTGNLAALEKTSLASKTSGRIVSLPFHEGDRVSAGEVVCQLDITEAVATIRQYEANVANLQVKVQQAITQYNQSVTNSQLAVRNAKSQLIAAQTTLEKTTAGNRPEEVNEASQQVQQQQANLDNAQWAYNREVQLYNAGAVARADLENALTTYKTNQTQLQYYKQNYEASKKGRPEDIANAQQSVRQYEIAYDNAIANLANAKINRDAIISDRAMVTQAQQQVAQYRQQLADLSIRTPYSGYLASRSVDLGQTISAGASIAEVDNIASTYFQPSISETDFRYVHPGQDVNVRLDAYPNRTFTGKVAAIFPSASMTARQFSIRVMVPNPEDMLRAGMYARGVITTAVHKNIVVVPLTALEPRSAVDQGATGSYGAAVGDLQATAQRVVLLGPGNTARLQNVEIGFRDDTYAEITSGLNGGETLITTGQTSLRDGDPVKVLPASNGH